MRLLVIGNRLLGDSLDSFPALLFLIRYFNHLKESSFATTDSGMLEITLLTYRYSSGLYQHPRDNNNTEFSFKEIHLIDEKTDYLESSSLKFGKISLSLFSNWKQYFRLIKFGFRHRGEYDGVLTLPGGFGWGLFAYLLKIVSGFRTAQLGRKRIATILVGHGHDWRSLLLSQVVPYYIKQSNYENFLNLAYTLINELNRLQNDNIKAPKFVLASPDSKSAIPSLQAKLLDEVKAHISSTLPQTISNSILSNIKSKPKWVIISPTASEVHKTWPGEYFYELALKILEQGYQVAWVGLERERETINTIRSKGKHLQEEQEDRWIGENLAGKFNLPELFAFIKNAHAFIGNDSGLAHAATMLGTTSVVIYGPSNPVLSQPFTQIKGQLIQIFNDGGIPVVERKSPCHRKALSMQKISPEQVWEKIEKIF